MDETYEIEDTEDLLKVLTKYPSARIVTDVGSSMFSGWGGLQEIAVHDGGKILEMIFS
jgi:hypothetical protein